MSDIEEDIIEGSDEEEEAMTASEVLQKLEEVKDNNITRSCEM